MVAKDFNTRISNLLFDLVHKADDKEVEENSFVLKRLSKEIEISLKKIKRC